MSMTTIQNLKAQKDSLIEAMRTQGKDALKGVFKEFFEKYPDVESVRWRQYTPYFNDGEPCTFRLGEMKYRLEDASSEDEGDYGEGYNVPCSGWGGRTKSPFYDSLHEIERIDNELFEFAFGDHAQVTATREGFEVEAYDHD